MNLSISRDRSMVQSFYFTRNCSNFYMSYDDINKNILKPLSSFLSYTLNTLGLKNDTLDLCGNYSYKYFVYEINKNILKFQTGDKYSETVFIYDLNNLDDRNIVQSFIYQLDDAISGVFCCDNLNDEDDGQDDEDQDGEDGQDDEDDDGEDGQDDEDDDGEDEVH